MTSTFRLTRAEFKKIFKRASVYIMALLLVVAILVSAYMFKPNEVVDETITYGENLTVEDYYNTFINQDLSNAKKGIDKAFAKTDLILNYYSLSNDRDVKLTSDYDSLIKSIDTLKSETNTSIRDNYYASVKLNLKAYLDSFQDFSTLSDYEFTNYSKGEKSYYQIDYSRNIKALLDSSSKVDSYDFVSIYETNNYKDKLYEDLNRGKDYVTPTLYSLSKEIKSHYDQYNQAWNRGESARESLEYERTEIRKVVLEFKNYFTALVDNDFPVVLINTSLKNTIMENLDSAIEFLSASNFTGVTRPFPDYTSLKENLDGIDIANFYIKTFALDNTNIYQVKLTNATLESYKKIRNKVEENKSAILERIKAHKTDESVKNIQKSITEYNLLNKAYNELINDSIILNLSEKYRSEDFVNLYNYKLDAFNNYEYRESIVTNKYYINNNVYSNSFSNNFVFGQNSSTTTSAMDFMYFSMEICTVLIIIFGMMMICNLITSETESGTIKLLLTRPYKRSKIITAKLFATIFFVLTFVLFSSIISFAGGYFIYGYNGANILTVFNGSTAIVMNPIVLMLINILTLIFDIIFYVIVALMISILFKNYAGTISTCLVLIIVAYTLNALFASSFWFSLLPSMNLHLFKYFGNSFSSLATNSIIQSIMITPIQSTMNFVYSLLLILGYSAVSIAISYAVFNKRDF